MTVDYFQVAKDITRAHAALLNANEAPEVGSLLLEIGRCPSCGAPLIRGSRISYCTDCGSEVTR